MTPLPSSPSSSVPCVGSSPAPAARPSRLMAGIYRDIGMAAVAIGLDLAVDSLEPAAHQSVKRGSRYIYLMPHRDTAPAPGDLRRR